MCCAPDIVAVGRDRGIDEVLLSKEKLAIDYFEYSQFFQQDVSLFSRTARMITSIYLSEDQRNHLNTECLIRIYI